MNTQLNELEAKLQKLFDDGGFNNTRAVFEIGVEFGQCLQQQGIQSYEPALWKRLDEKRNEARLIIEAVEAINKFPYDEDLTIKTEEAREEYLATYFAQWGADQELKASCDLIYQHEGSPLCGGMAEWLRDTRRPKSLHQQALDVLDRLQAGEAISRNGPELEIIRRALEEKE